MTCIFGDGVEKWLCHGCNISEGGALVRTPDRPLPRVGALVELQLEVEEIGPLPAIDGEVIRQNSDDGLFAVRFLNMDHARRAIVRRIVSTAGSESTDGNEFEEGRAGTYGTSPSHRKITQVYEKQERSELVQASKPTVPHQTTARDHATAEAEPYSNIEDAVRGASAEYSIVAKTRARNSRLPDLALAPILAMSLDAIPWHRLNPLAAVVLSKVNGHSTYEEILASAEVSRDQAAELVRLLLEQGIIRTRDS